MEANELTKIRKALEHLTWDEVLAKWEAMPTPKICFQCINPHNFEDFCCCGEPESTGLKE